MLLTNRIAFRWHQFRDETQGLVEGFQSLLVNLVCLKLKFPEKQSVIVILDSRREAVMLWLLWLCNILPRYEVWVIRRAGDLELRLQRDFGGELLLVASARVFCKHYGLLVELRRQRRLIVL